MDETHETNIAFNSGKALLDLDTGKTLGPIARGGPSKVPEFDVYAGFGPGNSVVLMGQLKKLGRVDAKTWTEASEKTLREQARKLALSKDSEKQPLPDQQVLADESDKTPQTWLVETNQGGVAILQAEYRDDIKTEFSGIQKGFLVRYKRVPNDSDATLKEERSNGPLNDTRTELQRIQRLEDSAETKNGSSC